MDGIIAYALAKKYADSAINNILDAGFKVQVKQDRTILNGVGEEKTLYLIPKESETTNKGYDEYIYTNTTWKYVGSTDVNLEDYATKDWVNANFSEDEIFVGDETPDDEQIVWIDTSDNESIDFYVKPQNGIPTTDLENSAQRSLEKANTALQSYTEQYTGTINCITMNGETKGTSGNVDLGTVITSHQDISGKENSSNKISEWSSVPNDTNYPSELLVMTGFTFIANNYTKNPVLIYDKTEKLKIAGTINSGADGVNGLINRAQGEGSSHDITSWNIEGMDLSPFRYIRVVFRRNNASYAETGEFNIPLDCDYVETRNIYVNGCTSSVYGDRNRLLSINCAVDSTKSKFCVTQTISLYGTMVTEVSDLFVEKIYGCY